MSDKARNVPLPPRGPPGTLTGGPGHDAVMAWWLVENWPLLGFRTVAPMPDKECLLHLAAQLDSGRELDARERYFAGHYLRRFAELPAARRRGRRPGQAWNKALHFAVRTELCGGNHIEASEQVARIWSGGAKSVRDAECNAAARSEIERLIRLRLAGPSYHPQSDGSAVHKEWCRAEILAALDTMLMSRAQQRKK